MSDLILTAVPKIAEEHRLAQLHAGAAKASAQHAVGHARAAGMLLLQVKAEIGHGKFLPWLEQNFDFTARTAQRYMNAAAPNPKATLSHLSNRPKPGSKRALLSAEIDRVRHRDDVVAHAAFLVGELPEVGDDLRPADVDSLTALRDRLNLLLERVAIK